MTFLNSLDLCEFCFLICTITIPYTFGLCQSHMFHCLIMSPVARIHPGMVPSKLQFKVIATDYYIDDMHACCFVVYSISS